MFGAYIHLRRQSLRTSFVTSLYQKKQKNEILPPTFNSLLQHLKQSNYQAIVWRHAFEAMQDLEPPEGHGWVRDEEHFASLLVIKAPAPESLFELTTCKCKTSACLKICCCISRRLGLHGRVPLHGRR